MWQICKNWRKLISVLNQCNILLSLLQFALCDGLRIWVYHLFFYVVFHVFLGLLSFIFVFAIFTALHCYFDASGFLLTYSYLLCEILFHRLLHSGLNYAFFNHYIFFLSRALLCIFLYVSFCCPPSILPTLHPTRPILQIPLFIVATI